MRCACRHSASKHSSAPPESVEKIREAMVEILAEWLYQKLENSDQRNCTKSYLYQIRLCYKSGCRDFNYSWNIPFGGTEICKCGSRIDSHSAWYSPVNL